MYDYCSTLITVILSFFHINILIVHLKCIFKKFKNPHRIKKEMKLTIFKSELLGLKIDLYYAVTCFKNVIITVNKPRYYFSV